MLVVFLNPSPTWILRKGLSFGLELSDFAAPLDHVLQESTSSASPLLGLQKYLCSLKHVF